MAIHSPIIVARFWSKVSVGADSECWTWRGAKRKAPPNGYGSFRVAGRRVEGAHRVAWEIFHGEPMGDRVACHHCDNPECCNPAHIYAGDRLSNARDAVERGRLKPGNQAGASNGNAKLTEDDVAAIRRRIDIGETNVSIARDYPVSHAMISKIRRGHFWRAA